MDKCNSENCDKCFECGMYWTSHSAHYDSVYNREVINISCCYGKAGTYDAETGERIDTI